MAIKYESKKTSVVKGHRTYKDIWTPTISKELPVKPQDDNEHDEYAVTVMKNSKIVSHLSRTILHVKLSCHSVGFSFCRHCACWSLSRSLLVGNHCHIDVVPCSWRLL